MLLQATRETLAKYGAQGAGVREICKNLGVSPGLLTHYYKGKEDLFLAAYADMSAGYLQQTQAVVAQTNASPEDRLQALFALYFSDDWSGDETIGTFAAFWSLSRTIPALKDAFEDTFAAQRTAFEQLVTELIRARGLNIEPTTFATFLLVFLEGVWLEISLNPGSIDTDSIQAFCWDWMESYMAAKGSPPT